MRKPSPTRRLPLIIKQADEVSRIRGGPCERLRTSQAKPEEIQEREASETSRKDFHPLLIIVVFFFFMTMIIQLQREVESADCKLKKQNGQFFHSWNERNFQFERSHARAPLRMRPRFSLQHMRRACEQMCALLPPQPYVSFALTGSIASSRSLPQRNACVQAWSVLTSPTMCVAA